MNSGVSVSKTGSPDSSKTLVGEFAVGYNSWRKNPAIILIDETLVGKEGRSQNTDVFFLLLARGKGEGEHSDVEPGDATEAP